MKSSFFLSRAHLAVSTCRLGRFSFASRVAEAPFLAQGRQALPSVDTGISLFAPSFSFVADVLRPGPFLPP